MKKTILLAASALLFGTAAASAQISTPLYWEENFVKMGEEGDYLTPEWTTYGVDATPISDLIPFYGTLIDNSDKENPVYGAPYYNYILLNVGDQCFPISCTNFDPEATADQWIITPEIEIPEGSIELKFDTFSYTISTWTKGRSCPYDVMISTTGTAKEDFTTVYSGSISPAKNETATRTVCIPLPDAGGKKARIAFVNKGANVGNIGFGNIKVCNYAFVATNQTETVAPKGSTVPVRVNIGLKTPVECGSFTAVLEFGGKSFTKTFSKSFGGRGTSIVYQLIEFNEMEEQIDLSEGESVTYTLTVTPDFEGAKPSVVTGTVVVPKKYYTNNVVMEEYTATGCGWCPRGMGAVQYYKDILPGEAGQGKFIGINVHSNMNYQDPMNYGVQAYVSNGYAQSGNTGLPQAAFNRVTCGVDPSRVRAFTEEAEAEALYKAEIKAIVSKDNITIDDEISVNYDVRAGFTSDATPLSAAVVLVENDVNGSESGYNQENYLATRTYSQCGIEGVPEKYYTKFLMGGDYGSEIRFDAITYQEVARGIWPSYYGEDIQMAWVADVAHNNNITFKVPENLVNLDKDGNLITEKYEVIILILDNETKAIVASDIMNLSKHVAGVNDIAADSAIKVNADRAAINVVAEGNLNVDLYTVDGMHIGNYRAQDGNVTINASDLNGVVILKAANGSETISRKLVF